MKTRTSSLAITLGVAFVIGSSLGISAANCCEKKCVSDGFVSMFNGKNMTGWETDPNGWWRFEDGTLTAQSTPENPCNKQQYLYWKGGEPADFIIRFRYKATPGDSKNFVNSGLQFRSDRRPNWDVFGYQADITANDEYVGGLYHHARGAVAPRGEDVVFTPDGKKTVKRFADSNALFKTVKQNAWNDYEVTAIGSKITLKINGILMAKVDDRAPKHSRQKGGVLALQMHPGPPMKIQFKDLRIKILDK